MTTHVHDVIATVLVRRGVEAVFAVMGDANMRWLADLSVMDGVKTYYARSEAAAIAMADGYSRATGRVAIASVTVGPGLTVGTTSLITAARHRSPVVVIAGDVPHGNRAHVQYIDQQRFLESIGVTGLHLGQDDAPTIVDRALTLAAAQPGPVVLNTRTDLQELEYPWDLDLPDFKMPVRPRLRPDTGLTASAAELLLGAERPVILAGRGARESGARDAIRQLGEQVGAVLSTTLLAKGYFRDDPFDVGVVGLFASDLCQELVSQADVVLAVGAGLNHYTTESGLAFPFAQVIRIDDRPNLPRDGIAPVALHLQADATAGIEALIEALDGRRSAGYRTEELAVRIATDEPTNPAHDRAYETDGRLDPRLVMRHVNTKLGADDITVIGMGHFWWFAINFLEARADDSFIYTHDFGAIGQGIATGIGAAIGRPDRRVTIVEGDASALMAIQELDTAARYGAAIRVLVMNDEGVGAEYHHLQSVGLDPRDSIIPSPDLAAVARGFGARGIRLDTPGLVAQQMDDAWDQPGPTLFDVRISREVMSEPNRKLWYPTLLDAEPDGSGRER